MKTQPIRAVLFDLGNTLVSYYTRDEFPAVLRACLRRAAEASGDPDAGTAPDRLFDRAMALNCEADDFAVRPLEQRLAALFRRAEGSLVDPERVTRAFLEPILELARLDPRAHACLDDLRARGFKTAIISNTPWGSPAHAWREELERHGLLQRVDAAVFCVDVGWRKPHPEPFRRALELLGVTARESLFVGDDPPWDVAGARAAGIRPVIVAPQGEPGPPDCTAIRSLNEVVELATSIDRA
jgi:putative hydrolase of the HAD superfamily